MKLLPRYIKVHGHVYQLAVPSHVKFRGALYRLALQIPKELEDELTKEAKKLVHQCDPRYVIRGKSWCVYEDGATKGNEGKLFSRHVTKEEALANAKAFLFRRKYLGL